MLYSFQKMKSLYILFHELKLSSYKSLNKKSNTWKVEKYILNLYIAEKMKIIIQIM